MAMSRKHYVAIAKILNDADVIQIEREDLIEQFVAVFKSDNPYFDPQRFRIAADPTLDTYGNLLANRFNRL